MALPSTPRSRRSTSSTPRPGSPASPHAHPPSSPLAASPAGLHTPLARKGSGVGSTWATAINRTKGMSTPPLPQRPSTLPAPHTAFGVGAGAGASAGAGAGAGVGPGSRPGTGPPVGAADEAAPSFGGRQPSRLLSARDPNSVFRDVFVSETQALNRLLLELRRGVQHLLASLAACEAALLAALPRGGDLHLVTANPAFVHAVAVLQSDAAREAMQSMHLLLRGLVPPAWLSANATDRSASDICKAATMQLDDDPLNLQTSDGALRDPTVPPHHVHRVQLYAWLERLHDRHAQLLLWQSYMDAYREENLSLLLGGHTVDRPGMLHLPGLGQRFDGGLSADGLGASTAPPLDTPLAGSAGVSPLPPVVWLTGLHNPKRFLVALQHAVALHMGCSADEVHLVARVTADFDTVDADVGQGAAAGAAAGAGARAAGGVHGSPSVAAAPRRGPSTLSPARTAVKSSPKPTTSSKRPGQGLSKLSMPSTTAENWDGEGDNGPRGGGAGSDGPSGMFDHIQDGVHASGFLTSGVLWDAVHGRLLSISNTAASGLTPGVTTAVMPVLRLTLQRLPRGDAVTSPSVSLSYLTTRRRNRLRRRLSVTEESVAVLQAYASQARQQALFVVELPVESAVPVKHWLACSAALVLGD